MAFSDNLKKLPGISHLAAIELRDGEGHLAGIIENKSGSQGSLTVYNHLAQVWGSINADAAKQGLDVFAEHTADARTNPGKHPNIDRLLAIAENGGEALRVKHVFAIDEDLPA